MLNRFIVTGALIAAASASAAAWDQVPRNPTPRDTTATRGDKALPETPTRLDTTTVIGCVYEEKDVPGRAPNAAERAGISEDYILAEVSTRATGVAGATGTSGSPAAASAAGSGPMFKLEDVKDDRLKMLVGKRVEVVGRVLVEAGDTIAPSSGERSSKTDRILGRDDLKLSDLEVASIKEVAGTCPATPGSAQ